MAPADITSYDYQINTTSEKTVRMIATQFGDGYMHRALEGINTLQIKWPIVFGFMTYTTANALQNLLQDGMVDGVLWKSPEDVVIRKYLIVDGWQLTFHNRTNNISDSIVEISTTLQLLYEP